MTKFFKSIWEFLKIIIIALAIVLPIRIFIFQPFLVKGASMEPNFHNGDYLIVDEISYRFRAPERGEVIVFKYPKNPSQKFIKRIVGLPGEIVKLKGEKIEITKSSGEKFSLDESSYLHSLTILSSTNKVFQLGKEEYFVLGDNRSFSFDSRKWGPLPREYIVGRVILRLWPLKGPFFISRPTYKKETL